MSINVESPEKNCLNKLKEIDFELAYLVLLTREGLKPLSRWEKPLNQNGVNLLKQMGLTASQISRKVQNGNVIVETVFSRTTGFARLYEKQFQNTFIDKSSQTQRIEGFLFGFPACCVNTFIEHPYAPNELLPEQQKILFHWACNHCRITPLLLPAYQDIYRFLENS